MKTVLLDSNALLLPVLQGVDIFDCLSVLVREGHEVATLSSIVGELERLKSSGSRRGVAAKVALELVKKKKVRVYETRLKPDASILAFSLENRDTIVCTNDGKLKKELRKNSIPVIAPKGRNYMTFT